MAETAWKRFQSIEAEGGIVAAIAEGSLLREIAETREARLARVARGDIKIIGVNAFRGGATTATVRRAPVKRTGPLTFKRLSAPFEASP
jgi:methylmalonyl-CoA mutase